MMSGTERVFYDSEGSRFVRVCERLGNGHAIVYDYGGNPKETVYLVSIHRLTDLSDEQKVELL